ncbi:MAG: hypothetical protein SH856_13445 [Flavobacteriales bacterium]|nr:hypothetical protein [Flavobacteriales bacterium]
MKLKFFLVAAILTLMFASCDKFRDKRYSTHIIADFECSVTDNGGTLDIDISETLTSMINEELEAVKDKIKSYELISIKYKIWEYVGDASATFVGSLGIGNLSSTLPGVSYEFNDISLQAGNDDTAHVLMSLNSSEIDKIEQYFLDTDGLKLFLEGNVTHVPMSFILQVVVDIDAIAEEKK